MQEFRFYFTSWSLSVVLLNDETGQNTTKDLIYRHVEDFEIIKPIFCFVSLFPDFLTHPRILLPIYYFHINPTKCL